MAEEGALRPRLITKGVAATVQAVRAFFEQEKHQQQRIGVSNVVARTAAANESEQPNSGEDRCNRSRRIPR